VAAVIVVVVAVAAALIWWDSDARATVSRPAAAPAPSVSAARAVPANLRQLWTAQSSDTDQPVIVGHVVVTGTGNEVAGHDPNTGIFRGQLELDKAGYIISTDGPATNIDGVFACGDVRSGPVKRVASAVGEGSMAIAFVQRFVMDAESEALTRAAF